MNTWKHKDWQTFKGTWLIVAKYDDAAIYLLILNHPEKYGDIKDWSKQ